MADLNQNRGVFVPARAGGPGAGAGNVANIADRLQGAYREAVQGHNVGLLQIAIKCSSAQVALQAGALNLYVPSNLVQQNPAQPPPIPKRDEDSEREPKRPFPTSVLPGPLKKLLDDLRDVLKPLVDALQYALPDVKKSGRRPGQPPDWLQQQAEQGRLLTLRAFTPAERAPFEAPARAGPPPIPGGAGTGAAAFGESAGLRGAGAAAAVPLAMITAVMKSIELSQRQFASMRDLAHASPSMAGVFAQAEAQDLIRNIKRGEALAEGARELNHELQRFKNNIEGAVQGVEKAKNWLGTNLMGGVNSLLESTGLSRLTGGEDPFNPRFMKPGFGFDFNPFDFLDWRGRGRQNAAAAEAAANIGLFDLKEEFFAHRRRFVEHADDFGPDDLKIALRRVKDDWLAKMQRVKMPPGPRKQMEDALEEVVQGLVRKERLTIEGRLEPNDVPAPYAVWNEIARRTTLEKHLHNPQFNRPDFSKKAW